MVMGSGIGKESGNGRWYRGERSRTDLLPLHMIYHYLQQRFNSTMNRKDRKHKLSAALYRERISIGRPLQHQQKKGSFGRPLQCSTEPSKARISM
jgi:hypothetical protein